MSGGDSAFNQTLEILLAIAITATLGAWVDYGTNFLQKHFPKTMKNVLQSKLYLAILLTVATLGLYRYAATKIK